MSRVASSIFGTVGQRVFCTGLDSRRCSFHTVQSRVRLFFSRVGYFSRVCKLRHHQNHTNQPDIAREQKAIPLIVGRTDHFLDWLPTINLTRSWYYASRCNAPRTSRPLNPSHSTSCYLGNPLTTSPFLNAPSRAPQNSQTC